MITLIPNQLVKLYKTETFNERNKKFHQDYRTYCQIVKQEQTTYFQLKSEAEGSQLFTNGDFTSDLLGWATSTINGVPTWQWSSGDAFGIGGYPEGESQLYQSQNLQANTLYSITVNIELFSGPSDAYIDIRAFSGELHAKRITRSEYGDNPGQVTMYFYTGAYTFHLFQIVVGGSFASLAYLNYAYLYKHTTPTVTLETCTGTNIKNIPVLDTGNGRLTYAVEWFGLDDDCYRLCITDTEDLNKNYLAEALALTDEGGQPIETEDGEYLNWM